MCIVIVRIMKVCVMGYTKLNGYLKNICDYIENTQNVSYMLYRVWARKAVISNCLHSLHTRIQTYIHTRTCKPIHTHTLMYINMYFMYIKFNVY